MRIYFKQEILLVILCFSYFPGQKFHPSIIFFPAAVTAAASQFSFPRRKHVKASACTRTTGSISISHRWRKPLGYLPMSRPLSAGKLKYHIQDRRLWYIHNYNSNFQIKKHCKLDSMTNHHNHQQNQKKGNNDANHLGVCTVHNNPRSLYVHIPFCRRRCYYCDFPIKVVGDNQNSISNQVAKYINLLDQELGVTSSAILPAKGSKTGLNDNNIDGFETIFFGGGTPSLLNAKELEKILDIIKKHLLIDKDVEISMEMDPGTFDMNKLKDFLALGINRVSLGVQSFDDEILKLAGRSHSSEEVYESIAMMKACNFNNFSIDLIGGLPTLTLSKWKETLKEAVSLSPAHISVYDLTIEEGTAFGKWYSEGGKYNNAEDDNNLILVDKNKKNKINNFNAEIEMNMENGKQDDISSRSKTNTGKEDEYLPRLPSEEIATEMYILASSYLQENGYNHYEISNYAKEEYQCQHNRVYWEGKPFLAIGMGAASYINGYRFARPRSLSSYTAWVESLVLQGHDEATLYLDYLRTVPDHFKKHDRIQDLFMTSLRLKEGLDFVQIFDLLDNNDIQVQKLIQTLQPFLKRDKITIKIVMNNENEKDSLTSSPSKKSSCKYKNYIVSLKDPEGFLISNDIISSLFAALS